MRGVVVVMGVSGAGKTTVGRALARELGAAFFDADDYHPAANVAKMIAGQPLDDADRRSCLARLAQRQHFMPDKLLASQFAALEEPTRAIVDQIMATLP